MTFSACCVCDKEERDDLIPNWLQFHNGRLVCDACQEIIIEKSR